MKDNRSILSVEQFCAAINAAAGLDRAGRNETLTSIPLPYDCHSIELRYDGSDALVGYLHSAAESAGLNAASVARLMSICRLSSISSTQEPCVEEGVLLLTVMPVSTVSAQDASRG